MTQNIADNWIMVDTDTDDAENNRRLRLLDMRAQLAEQSHKIERYRSEDLEGVTEYRFCNGRIVEAIFYADDGDSVEAGSRLEIQDWYRKSQQDEQRIS